MSENAFPQDQVYVMPPGLRVYAIGDVHGCLDLLHRMHEAIALDLLESPPESAHIVYLGDFIDRGPDSRGVIETLIERRDRGDGVGKTFLMGNHELGLFEFLDNPEAEIWTQWGGMETLASYGLEFPGNLILPGEKTRTAHMFAEVLPPTHRSFLQSLSPSVQIGDYLFAHAGVDPRKPMEHQALSDLTFIREPFLSWHKDPLYRPLPFKIVHGHSIYPAPENRPHRISVDTGAYAGGPLSCAVLEGADVRFLQVT